MTMRPFRLAALLATALPLFAQSPLHLIPQPRELRPAAALPLPHGVQLTCAAPCDPEDAFAVSDLKATLSERGIPVNANPSAPHVLVLRFGTPMGRSVYSESLETPAAGGSNNASMPPEMAREGYAISPDQDGIAVTAGTSAGIFYALQTVKQLIEGDGAKAVLHAASIRDWPALQYRGLSDDLSRGPVDTLEFQKKLIRTLAAYKDNLYSPYFENTQQYLSNPLPAPPGGSISPADARELVAYAARYHVMIVPDQEAFGHLHHDLVWDEYSQLAETPHGAVLAPGQPGSLTVIKQMFTELAALYPSPFLHVGADETVDLGLGQTKPDVDARGLGPVYLDFMQRIDTTLRPLGRRLLFWGDIAENSPELLKNLPPSFKQNTVAISWHYSPNPNGFTKYLNYFRSSGFETWVAPGINNWSRVYPNYNMGLANIQQFTRDGQKMGATGQMNTIWYDDGEALASNNWYGILFGCAAAWQPGESSIPQFQASYAEVFHGDTTGKLNQAQQELMAAHDVLKFEAKVGDGSDGLFWLDPWSKGGQQYAAEIRPYTHELRMHAEKALELVAQARAAYPPVTAAIPSTIASAAQTAGSATGTVTAGPNGSTVALKGTGPSLSAPFQEWASAPEGTPDPRNALPSNPTTLRETDAIDALELGARRLDFIGLKFQLADEIATGYAQALANSTSQNSQDRRHVSSMLSDINGVDGRIQDIKDGYSLIRDLYAQSWLRTDRAYALRPVLEHYDYTVGLWLERMDKVRSAQRQWTDDHTLPPAAELGVPPAPPAPTALPPLTPSSVPAPSR
jgi:hypothetical protein